MVLFLRCKPLGFGSVALHDKGPRGSAARWVPFRGHRIACCRKRAREGDRDKPEAKREYRNEQQSKKAEREAFSLRSGTICKTHPVERLGAIELGASVSRSANPPRKAGVAQKFSAHHKPALVSGGGRVVTSILSDESRGDLRCKSLLGDFVIAGVLFDEQVTPVAMPCGNAGCP